MYNYNNNYHSTQPMARGFMPKVFGWMMAGLGITAGVSYLCSPEVNPALFMKIVTGPIWLLAIVQFGLVMFYSARWQELSPAAGATIFATYSALNGLLLAPLAYIYTGASLMQTFIVAAGTFATMALYGWVTDHDLSSYSGLLTMGMFGLVISLVVNLFFQSSTFDLIISCVGVLIFTVLTAYNVQTLKQISQHHFEDSQMRSRVALVGALQLYMNLLNLFLYLLRLLGQRRD